MTKYKYPNQFFITSYNLFCEYIPSVLAISKGTILMLHGNASNGLYWKITPDGRTGWADYFAQKGFDVFVPDWPGIGRSQYFEPGLIDNAVLEKAFGEMIEILNQKLIVFTHSSSGPFGWKLLENYSKFISHIIAISPGPMGNIQPITDILSESNSLVEAKMGPITYKIDLNSPIVLGKDFYLKKFIGAGTQFPLENLDSYLGTLVPARPKVMYERLNIKGSAPKISTLKNSLDTKVLVVVGDSDPDYPKEIVQKTVNFLKENKIVTTFYWLSDFEIFGNAHMLMIEKNNLKIADLIIKYLDC
jgi:pimeloyl-ACP methyl ester carboxylesterase